MMDKKRNIIRHQVRQINYLRILATVKVVFGVRIDHLQQILRYQFLGSPLAKRNEKASSQRHNTQLVSAQPYFSQSIPKTNHKVPV